MTTGTVQTVLVCGPAPGSPAQAPCLQDQSLQTASFYLVHPDQATLFENASEQIDAASASTVFFAAFSAVVTCFYVARVVGSVVGMIRK